MTSRERRSLPPIISLLFTLTVVGLAVVVLYEVAAAAGVSPLGPGGTPAPAAAVAATAPGSSASPAPSVIAALGSPAVIAALGSPAVSGSPGGSYAPADSGSPALDAGSATPAGSPAALAPASSGSAAASAGPLVSPSALKPPPTAGPFAMDLYRRGDFVSEMNKASCVAAAMQTMVNIMSSGADTTVATQKRLYALARKLSPKTLKGPGAEPEGWARGLVQLGFGPYVVDVQPTRTAAIRAAARALRLTGRPVGILAWRGAHSWVMSGFKATADPALTDRFTVTAVNIEDVWYPRVSTIWGASRRPDALVPVGLLHEDILPWRRPTGPYPGKDGKYVLVLPVAAGR